MSVIPSSNWLIQCNGFERCPVLPVCIAKKKASHFAPLADSLRRMSHIVCVVTGHASHRPSKAVMWSKRFCNHLLSQMKSVQKILYGRKSLRENVVLKFNLQYRLLSCHGHYAIQLHRILQIFCLFLSSKYCQYDRNLSSFKSQERGVWHLLVICEDSGVCSPLSVSNWNSLYPRQYQKFPAVD